MMIFAVAECVGSAYNDVFFTGGQTISKSNKGRIESGVYYLSGEADQTVEVEVSSVTTGGLMYITEKSGSKATNVRLYYNEARVYLAQGMYGTYTEEMECLHKGYYKIIVSACLQDTQRDADYSTLYARISKCTYTSTYR